MGKYLIELENVNKEIKLGKSTVQLKRTLKLPLLTKTARTGALLPKTSWNAWVLGTG